MLNKLIVLLLLLSAFPVRSEEYQAPMTNTHWQVVQTPLKCSLSQSIPGFGEAEFTRQTGDELKLTFRTNSQPATQNNAQFAIVEAPWQNSTRKTDLISVATRTDQQQFSISGSLARQALTKLQEGQFPAVTYRSQNSDEPITAVISTIHFSDSFPAFQQCVEQLFPHTFKQMADTSVYFGLEKSTLTAKAKQKLKSVADYIKIDKKISQVKIAGYTDNHGYRRINRPLSQQRVDAVKDYLVKDCKVSENLITSSSYMDLNPAASNKTAKGRALNRRAEVTLIR